MNQDQRELRRDTFLGQAADYFAARPGYPPKVFQFAADLADFEPQAPVLEVGCGTGEATEWFARQGLQVLAMDRSAEMITLARQRLEPYGNVEFRCQDFEHSTGLSGFAALLFATSYHWLSPESRVARCASVLRPGGALILAWHIHPLPYTDYFARSQSIYKRIVPGWAPPASPGASEDNIRAIVRELQASSDFPHVERTSHEWSRAYDTALYLRLLNTYSDHRLLPDAVRSNLLDELQSLIDREFGGVVQRPYRTEIVVAIRS